MKPSDLIGQPVDIARSPGTPSQWCLMAIDGTTAHLRRADTGAWTAVQVGELRLSCYVHEDDIAPKRYRLEDVESVDDWGMHTGGYHAVVLSPTPHRGKGGVMRLVGYCHPQDVAAFRVALDAKGLRDVPIQSESMLERGYWYAVDFDKVTEMTTRFLSAEHRTPPRSDAAGEGR